jgi:nucleoside-diphosphate-sugar epimerase
MQNILISGSEGYVGRSIFQHLRDEHELNVYGPSFSELDFRDQRAVVRFYTEKKIDTLIHCAAVSLIGKHYPEGLLEDNCRMFLNAICCRDLGARLINFCSGSIFGRSRWRMDMKEEDALDYVPNDVQSFAKFLFEKFRRESASGYLNIRIFGLYGGDENYLFKFIPNTIAKALLNLPIEIATDRRMSNTHILDLCDFIKFVISDTRIFNCDLNFGSPPILLSKLAGMILDLIPQSKSKIIIYERGLDYSGDNTRFKDLFPDFLYREVIESLVLTIDYWKERTHLIDKSMLSTDQYLKAIASGAVGNVKLAAIK